VFFYFLNEGDIAIKRVGGKIRFFVADDCRFF